MKAAISLLVLVLVAGAGFMLISGRTGEHPLSGSSQAVSLYEEGTADLNAFRLNDAREKLETSLELDPELAEASISLAFTLAQLGRIPEFRETLARADSLTGNLTDPERRMMAQLRLGSSSSSRYFAIRDSLLKRLRKDKPENIHVLVTLAGRCKTDDEREQAWRHVLDVDPNYANAYNMLGYLELHRDNYEKAAEYMQKYAFLAPDLANPHDSLGDVYFAQGRYEEAEAEYVKSVTMQPDFYTSLINLGRVYLARGQIHKGLDILEKVRAEVTGSRLEQRVDREIMRTLVNFGIEDKLDEVSATYMAKWPDDHLAIFFRAMRMAHRGDFKASQAVMDSALTIWRVNQSYQQNEQYRSAIDRTGKRYQALVSDLADAPATRVRHWAGLVAMNSDLPLPDQCFDRWKLGQALLDNNQPDPALEQIAPLLEINPRLISHLILAVRIHLARHDPALAREALNQAKWALAKADPDFPPLLKIKELEEQVKELEKGS